MFRRTLVTVGIEQGDGETQTVTVFVPSNRKQMKFYVSSQSDTLIGGFFREYVIGEGIREITGSRAPSRKTTTKSGLTADVVPIKAPPPPPKKLRIASNSTHLGHLQMLACAIMSDDHARLSTAPREEIEEARELIKRMWAPVGKGAGK